MSREQKYTAIILKKQPFGEADEIITFFTKEQGKVRALAKSVKLAKSKLQAKLQALFLVEMTLAGGKLPKITAVETLKVFESIRQNLAAVKMAFYASELVLKFTPDEQKNEQLFNLLENFFDALNLSSFPTALDGPLAKFKIGVLDAMGLGIRVAPAVPLPGELYFSLASGGFGSGKNIDAMPVSASSYQAFLNLKSSGFKSLPDLNNNIDELQNLLSRFIEYQLERKVKSEKYLNNGDML